MKYAYGRLKLAPHRQRPAIETAGFIVSDIQKKVCTNTLFLEPV